MTEDNETLKNRYLQLVAQKTDIRSKKPEFRIILDILQDISPATLQDLLDEINSTCKCEMFTYGSLHHHISALRMLGAVKQNEITKEIVIEPNQVTKNIEYLPLSSYCVFTLGVSVLFLAVSLYMNYMIIQTITAVVVGTIYIAAQLFGDELNTSKMMQSLKSLYLNIKMNRNTEKLNEQNIDKI